MLTHIVCEGYKEAVTPTRRKKIFQLWRYLYVKNRNEREMQILEFIKTLDGN